MHLEQPAIEISNLRKAYGGKTVVDGISLTVHRGEIFALLGPNGAGKTTTVEILEGHRSRDSGDVRVLGYDPARKEQPFKQRVGMVLQSTGIEPYLTVQETLEMFQGYYQAPMNLNDLIILTELGALRNTNVRKLSGGQQRKLDVAVALCGNPDVLFLDEPTTGFDPAARHRTWDMLTNLKLAGTTIFLTTHYMEEAAMLADHVAFIIDGKIVELGSVESLTRKGHGTTITFQLANSVVIPPSIAETERSDDGQITISTKTPTKDLALLTGWALETGTELRDLQVRKTSLEDVFFKLTSIDLGRENNL
jgi:ABC-2 type transport system ATP-binding protein